MHTDTTAKNYPEEAVVAWNTYRARLNKKAIAEYCGIHFSAVAVWRAVPDKHVNKVSEFTGIPIATLRPDLA